LSSRSLPLATTSPPHPAPSEPPLLLRQPASLAPPAACGQGGATAASSNLLTANPLSPPLKLLWLEMSPEFAVALEKPKPYLRYRTAIAAAHIKPSPVEAVPRTAPDLCHHRRQAPRSPPGIRAQDSDNGIEGAVRGSDHVLALVRDRSLVRVSEHNCPR
jgi:hypothetical protein